MNISQHSFVPLGFLVGFGYNDSMELVSASSVCTVLSPCLGHSAVSLSRLGYGLRFRAWSPLVSSSSGFIYDIVLSSVFLFSKNYPASGFDFNVHFLNF